MLWNKDKKKIYLSLNVLTLLALSFSLCEFVLLPTVNSFQPKELSLLFLSPQPSSPSLTPPFFSPSLPPSLPPILPSCSDPQGLMGVRQMSLY